MSWSYLRGLNIVRATIVLLNEEFRELKELAAAQDRSISWLLCEAFRLSKIRLQQAEPFAPSFDRVWRDIAFSLRQAGIKPSGIPRLVREVRRTKSPTTPKAKAR